MYCVTCGSLIDENLNYCNRCGNRVAKNELAKRSDATVSVYLAISTAFVGITGLGGLIGLIAILVANRVAPELVVFVSILFLTATFGICFMLTRQISRLTDNALSAKKNSNKKSAPEQLNSTLPGQIESPIAPFRSVTENTTRTLDKTTV